MTCKHLYQAPECAMILIGAGDIVKTSEIRYVEQGNADVYGFDIFR